VYCPKSGGYGQELKIFDIAGHGHGLRDFVAQQLAITPA
jgi:hypothetical protein